MPAEVITAVFSLVGTLVGTLGGIVLSSNLTNYRIERMEKKVEKHNNLISRTYELEKEYSVLDEQGNPTGETEEVVHEWDNSEYSIAGDITDHRDGTQADPIPAARGMEYEYGKYYLDGEDGKVYLCERTGEAAGGKITLQYLPHELVGNYFKAV